MKRSLAVPIAALLVTAAHPQVAVVSAPNATVAEKRAASELEGYLRQMGVRLRGNGEQPRQTIVVGSAEKGLGAEEFVIRSDGSTVSIGGGRPRGTVYGVYRFLHHMGVRWWTPWATTVPHRTKLPKLDIREAPAFEYREPYWHHAFDPDWAVHNCVNSKGANLDESRGGGTVYEGFVHTYYPLIPPEKYFGTHPEWFSLIDGKRTTENAQLCTTNPEMRRVLLEEVRQKLRANPGAAIVSVSQNDCFNPCQCDVCQALAKDQGSEAAPVLDLANYVADGIRDEFPNVAVDTLAYQYTRHAPKSLRPRPNVIVRLCSIECDFGVPLTHPRNADFANDIRDWSRLTGRLYVWDYVTNFRHYVQPFPNADVLGPNLRFFSENGVKGVFEEGDYNANGGELSELKSWVMAQLLWNPKADPRKLRDEFLTGYYGPAALPIRRYIELMDRSAADHPARVFDDVIAGYLSYPVMRQAEALWQQAERSSRDPELNRRVRVGHLAVRYVWLRRWAEFHREATARGDRWPLPSTRKEAAADWLAVAQATGPNGWTPVSVVNESNLTAEGFVRQMSQDPPTPPHRHAAAAPEGVAGDWIDAQDDLASLWNEPWGAAFVADPSASDGGAVRMPGSHYEWAYQLSVERLPRRVRQGRWRIFVVARADAAGEGLAFTAGVYDEEARRILTTQRFASPQVGERYRAFDLGTLQLPAKGYLWVAPPGNARVQNLWIDRVYFVPA